MLPAGEDPAFAVVYEKGETAPVAIPMDDVDESPDEFDIVRVYGGR